jgi:DNA end-binding protein Ku
MRAIWSGSLSFGLINIPVKLYSASEERGINLDMLDKESHKPIGYARVIRGTDRVVKWENIVKGYKYQNGDYIVLLDEDFKRASPKKTRTIDIVEFVEADEIDSKYYEKPYYLEPDAKSTKAYALLREALAKSKKVAIATYVMREKEHVAAIKPEENALVLNQMRYAEDIRSTKGLNLPDKSEFKERELAMALQLVEQLTEHFKPEQFKDTYTDELMAIIEAKAKGQKPKAKAALKEEPTEDVDDLLAILRQSLTTAKPRGKTAAADRNGKAESGKPERVRRRAPATTTSKAGSTRTSKARTSTAHDKREPVAAGRNGHHGKR